MYRHKWKLGQKVRVTAGVDEGRVGTINRLGEHAVGLVGDEGPFDAGVVSLELVDDAPPPPPRPFVSAENPDGWRAPDPEALAALDLPERLAERVFAQHGRLYLSARGLAPTDVEPALDALIEGELGLHLSQLATGPGLDAWLAWGVGTATHLSFAASFLGGKGTEALRRAGGLEAVESLDLSVCDIGRKGLVALGQLELPALRELYLGANPDGDRGTYDARALQSLLAGEALVGLEVLGLLFWTLDGADELLASSPVIAGLSTLWIGDGQSVPPSVAGRCVVGWEQRAYTS